MRCPACEKENEETAWRCAWCGTRLRSPDVKADPIGVALLVLCVVSFVVFVYLEASTKGEFGWSIAVSLAGIVFGAALTMHSLGLAVSLALVVLFLANASYNYLDGWDRGLGARVATVQAEHRNIAVALASFRALEGRLPTQREYCIATHILDPTPTDDPPIEKTLTSPVSHIAALPGDPFRNRDYHYGYWTDGAIWVLRSSGPDRAETADLDALGGYLHSQLIPDASPPQLREGRWPDRYQAWLYDPTNGIESAGDVMKTGP